MNTKVKYNAILFLLFACITLRAIKIRNDTKWCCDVEIIGFELKKLPYGGHSSFTIYKGPLKSGAKKTISSKQTREIMISWKKASGSKKKTKIGRATRISAVLFSPTKYTTEKPEYIGKQHRIVFTKEKVGKKHGIFFANKKRFIDIKLYVGSDHE